MDGAKDVTTPLSTSVSLQLADGLPSVDSIEYRRVVGALQYLSLTRPDISFVVNKLSQFMHCPTQTHWTATKRLLRYLKNTVFHGINIRKTSSPTFTCFSDADWAGSLDDRKSTSAYVLFLGHTPISWSSKKQRAIARSSTEVEHKALATAAAESMLLLSLFQEMKFTLPQPPLLLCDNLGATQLSFNPVQHSRMKHIQIDIHFVRDLVEKNFLMFGMFSLMTSSLIYSQSHFPDKGQTIYGTRSDYPMVARSCRDVSRKLIISNKCQLKSSCHHEHYQILCLP